MYQNPGQCLYWNESERIISGMHDAHNFENRLLNVARGAQDPDLEAHIASCDACQSELFALRHLVNYQNTTGGSFVKPPRSLVTAMAGLLPRVRPDLLPKAHPSVTGRAIGRLRQITAQLILDTGATPYMAGLRGGTDRRTRQLAFVSDVADLDLEIAPLDNAWSVSGQLGMDAVPRELRIRFIPADQDPLEVNPEGAVESSMSDQGYFGVTLTEGEWVAAVVIEDATVLFQGIRV